MYRRILVPTDGSKLSIKALKTAFTLAKALGSQVTAVHVTPEFPTPVYSEGAMFTGYMNRADFDRAQAAAARKVLAAAEKQAATFEIELACGHTASNSPFEAILAAASRSKCDLIVMASHGRRGLSALILGSETQKVLTHSKIPVLVVR